MHDPDPEAREKYVLTGQREHPVLPLCTTYPLWQRNVDPEQIAKAGHATQD